jgi:TrmH family RNA methyltransferase
MSLAKKKARSIQALARKKDRGESGLFIVEGLRLTHEASDSNFVIEEAYYTREFVDDPRGEVLVQKLRKKTPAVHEVSQKELSQMSDTRTSQGVLAILHQKHESAEHFFARQAQASIVVALDGIADPGNLGSIIRTCAWFGIGGILLGQDCVDPYNPKVVRATMGGLFRLPIVGDADLAGGIAQAKRLGFVVMVADTSGGRELGGISAGGRILLLMGSEARGVSDSLRCLADLRVSIPRYGNAESLNVGVACGIVLAQLRRDMKN